MTRFVDTQLAQIPLGGPGVPEGNYTMPTSSWMPYSWSVNNVVLAEVMHTALAYWQAGRADGAFLLFKGAVLDAMFLGLCPGNVGMCTYFDAYRRESQRDFADGVGTMARAVVEGLFGVQPDALAGVLTIRPGFPALWTHASIRHPDLNLSFRRAGLKEVFAGGKVLLPNGVPLATPGAPEAKNIAFVSQWDNYPREISVPLTGQAYSAYLLLAGSTSAMQSRFDNGEVVVTYADGSNGRLALHNPTTWWPIDQDYYIDDFAFTRPEPLPARIDLMTGRVRVLEMESFKGKGRTIPGGAATVLELPLDRAKELKSLSVRALANEVVIGLMSVTLIR